MCHLVAAFWSSHHKLPALLSKNYWFRANFLYLFTGPRGGAGAVLATVSLFTQRVIIYLIKNLLNTLHYSLWASLRQKFYISLTLHNSTKCYDLLIGLNNMDIKSGGLQIDVFFLAVDAPFIVLRPKKKMAINFNLGIIK